MDKLKLILIIVAALVAVYLIAKILIETPFEKLSRDYISIQDYTHQEISQKNRSNEYQNSEIDFRDIYPTENRFLIRYFDQKHWVFWTGVQDLDDGLKFLYTPHYSRLVIVDRNTKLIVSDKLFFRRITNARIQDGYIYFVYSSWTGYKLGRYKL